MTIFDLIFGSKDRRLGVCRRVQLRLSAPELLIDEQGALTAAGHFLGKRRGLGNERHIPRWPPFEDLGQRLGTLVRSEKRRAAVVLRINEE